MSFLSQIVLGSYCFTGNALFATLFLNVLIVFVSCRLAFLNAQRVTESDRRLVRKSITHNCYVDCHSNKDFAAKILSHMRRYASPHELPSQLDERETVASLMMPGSKCQVFQTVMDIEIEDEYGNILEPLAMHVLVADDDGDDIEIALTLDNDSSPIITTAQSEYYYCAAMRAAFLQGIAESDVAGGDGDENAKERDDADGGDQDKNDEKDEKDDEKEKKDDEKEEKDDDDDKEEKGDDE